MNDYNELIERCKELRAQREAGECSDFELADALLEVATRNAELESERTKREEQEPVAHEYQGRDGIWRGFINQQHYKNTVEDGSWPIRALYAAPPVTAPVRLTDEQINEASGNGILDCLQDPYDKDESGDNYSSIPHDLRRFSRAIETAVLRANGFKVEE